MKRFQIWSPQRSAGRGVPRPYNPRLKTDVENARLSGSLVRPRLSRIALGRRRPMEYSVNVDLETINTSGGDPNCLEHAGAGPHYDITVHPEECKHHNQTRSNRQRRYWRDFATEVEAYQFANNIAAQPGVPTSHPVRVRMRRM
jgi:hypothetical protein